MRQLDRLLALLKVITKFELVLASSIQPLSRNGQEYFLSLFI